MKKGILFLLVVMLFCSYRQVAALEEPILGAKPGNIQGSFLVSSLDNIAQFAVPIAGYYLWGGGTGEPIAINFSYIGIGFTVQVRTLKFKTIDPLTQGSLKWHGDSGINLTITNITCDAHVDVRVWLLYIFPMWGLRIRFSDLNVTALVDLSEKYNRFPQIDLDLGLDYKKFDWNFFIVGWIVKIFLSSDKLLSLVLKAIPGAITSLNGMLNSNNPDQFLVNIMQDLSANVGPSMPIVTDKENDLIWFGLDGRIYNSTIETYSNEISQVQQERFPRAHSNQFFVHQSTIQAAARSLSKLYLPISLEDPSFNQLLGIYIPELFEKYGSKGSFKIEADINHDFDLNLSIEHGISLTNIGAGITIYGKKSGLFSKYEKAVTFSMNVDIEDVDVHIQELVVHTNIGKAKVTNSFLTSSSIGNIVRNNWDQFFESLINFKTNEVNVNNKEFDIKKLDQQIELSSGQIPNSTVAFNYRDEYMYLGIRFFSDD
ncbi:unnamed protein product [Moneuplotes crassus]|uniref:Uncharacterized protein n=2 Tax=Euplotes crassus TaxID=5936 RepID=A0AAD1UIJ0_EUPCR|nr:unnamed protein product [Moneuplotes crassus]